MVISITKMEVTKNLDYSARSSYRYNVNFTFKSIPCHNMKCLPYCILHYLHIRVYSASTCLLPWVFRWRSCEICYLQAHWMNYSIVIILWSPYAYICAVFLSFVHCLKLHEVADTVICHKTFISTQWQFYCSTFPSLSPFLSWYSESFALYFHHESWWHGKM